MKPQTRRILEVLLSKEWVSGNDLYDIAARYGARLDELKPLGYRWDKKWVKGSAVPFYRIHVPSVQLTLEDVA